MWLVVMCFAVVMTFSHCFACCYCVVMLLLYCLFVVSRHLLKSQYLVSSSLSQVPTSPYSQRNFYSTTLVCSVSHEVGRGRREVRREVGRGRRGEEGGRLMFPEILGKGSALG